MQAAMSCGGRLRKSSLPMACAVPTTSSSFGASPVVLWFGRADRAWSRHALRAVLPWAQVRLLSELGTAVSLPPGPWPAVVDLVVLEEHRPGQIGSACVQQLVRRYPLAGFVILQGPWSAASYSPAWQTDPEVFQVPWHDWPWWLRSLQRGKSPTEAPDQDRLVPLVKGGRSFTAPHAMPAQDFGTRRTSGARGAAGRPCWLLVADAELGRVLAEVLTDRVGTIRRWPPPPEPEQILRLAPGEPSPQTLVWQIGTWLPRHPWRELELLDRMLSPERIIALGVQERPALLATRRPVQAQIVFLPLPLPPGAFQAIG